MRKEAKRPRQRMECLDTRLLEVKVKQEETKTAYNADGPSGNRFSPIKYQSHLHPSLFPRANIPD